MPLGSGIYSKECNSIRESVKADGVLLMVIGGDRGSGFSAEFPEWILTCVDIPKILREIASSLEKDRKEVLDKHSI